MLFIIGAIVMIICGAALVFIGLFLPTYVYAIVGGIMVLAGIFWLVSIRRGGGPLARNLWGKADINQRNPSGRDL